MNYLPYFFVSISLILPSLSAAYTRKCQNEIQKQFIYKNKPTEDMNSGTVEMPRTKDEAVKLVFDYANHYQDKIKYANLVNNGRVVVFKHHWFAHIYDGMDLHILDSATCKKLTSFTIFRD